MKNIAPIYTESGIQYSDLMRWEMAKLRVPLDLNEMTEKCDDMERLRKVIGG